MSDFNPLPASPGAEARPESLVRQASMIECTVCGWRHTVPCDREDCPYDVATHYHYIATALDRAVANGGMDDLVKMSDEEVADDLARHDAYCERLGIPLITAGVQAWRSPQISRETPCNGNCHWWPADSAVGDTCNCGQWYRFNDRIEGTP